MNTRLLMAFIAMLAMVPMHNVYAQDVEGVDIHQKMTEVQIFSRFGNPDKIETQVDDEGVPTMMYYYGVNELFFTEGHLTDFLIKEIDCYFDIGHEENVFAQSVDKWHFR